jgi:predicted GNAT family acetyltransferase
VTLPSTREVAASTPLGGDNGRVGLMVADNPGRDRFEILVDDSLAGYAGYDVRPAAVALTHLEVDPDFTDLGVGPALVRGMLDQLGERGDRVIVECAFVAAFIERHPEYRALLGVGATDGPAPAARSRPSAGDAAGTDQRPASSSSTAASAAPRGTSGRTGTTTPSW